MASYSTHRKIRREKHLRHIQTSLVLILSTSKKSIRALDLSGYIEDATGIGYPTATLRSAVKEMVSNGIITPTGEGRNRAYQLVA